MCKETATLAMTPSLVSIIIPIYNVESYLRECLDSILAQTYKNLEVILIDDGSTDSSGAIAKEYASKDIRIHYFYQENQGAGSARNKGLEKANGEWVLFFDSDDFMRADSIALLAERARTTNAQITIAASNALHQIKIIPMPKWLQFKFIPNKTTFNYKDMPKHIFGFCVGWAWDKLYRRDFLLTHNLSFQNLPSTNDLSFTFTSLILADTITCLDTVLFTHRINVPTSLESTRDKTPLSFIEAIRLWKENLIRAGVYAEVKESYINWSFDFAMWYLESLNSTQAKDRVFVALRKTLKELDITIASMRYFRSEKNYKRFLYLRYIPLRLHKYNPTHNADIKSLWKYFFRIRLFKKQNIVRLFGITLYQSSNEGGGGHIM